MRRNIIVCIYANKKLCNIIVLNSLAIMHSDVMLDNYYTSLLQIEYSLANSHQCLSASNFIILCNVSVSCVPELYDCPKKVS